MFKLVFASAVIIGFCHPAWAAQPPKSFLGVWAATSEKLCRKTEWKEHQRDDLLSVDARSANYYETTCDFASIKLLDDSTAEVAMSCAGEGETWKTREIWNVQKVGQQRLLTMVSLIRSDVKNHKASVSIYIECQ
jgi:hypothetical protein